MAEKEKKFFWLKLKEDFFTSEIAIKKLRKIAGGDTYTIIYLKILLRSLRDSGKIFFEGVDDSFHEELALILDEEPDNVLFTLTFLERCGLLVKTSDYEYELTAIPNMTGAESESAPRVRKFREKQKTLQCNADVTECNEDVQKCNTEIELDLELELNKELKTEKKINIEPPLASAPAKQIKHKYGEYNNVLLTDEELEKLNNEFADLDQRIERLSEYMASKGTKYKSHYATIKSWARKETEQKPKEKGRLDWLDDIR